MRARTVNEDQNFERGKNPKAALGVGGINLYDLYQNKMKDLEGEISLAKINTDAEWEEYLRKNFVGKRITAVMTRMVTFNIKTKERSLDAQKHGEFTIEIQDIKPGENLSDAIGRNVEISPQAIVADMEGKIYTMRLNQKIYIN